MRQRSSNRSSGHVNQDLTDQLFNLIRNLEASKTPCTRPTLVAALQSHCNTTNEKAEAALDNAIRQRRIIELYLPSNQSADPVCHDVLRLKIRRSLRLSPNYDLSYIVRTALLERGARSSQDARSTDELHDHIMTTYNLQENSVENLSSCLDKAIKLLLKKNQIETKVPLNDNDTRYFLTSTVPPVPTTPSNNKPSTSTTKDENSSTISPSLPNHKPSSKRREKRLSEASNHHHHQNNNQVTESSNKSELKSLQDSLSAFFTPSNVRRSRVAQSSFSLEHLNDHKVRSPLEVVINNGSEQKKLVRQHSNEIHSISSSKHSSPSPNNNKRTDKNKDKLFDSLSPYFSANKERRRKHEKGEFLQLSNGLPPRKKGRSSMHSNTDTNSLLASIEKPSRHSDFFDDEVSESDDETLNSATNQNNLLTVHRKAAFDSTPIKNESIAELEVARASPSTSHKRNRSSNRHDSPKKSTTRSSQQNQLKPSKNLKSFKSQKTRNNQVSNNLLRRARKQCNARLAAVSNQGLSMGRRASSVLPISPKKSRNEVPASSTVVNNSTKTNPLVLSSPIRRASFSPVKAFNLSSSSKTSDESLIKIAKTDEALYHKTRSIVQKRMDENSRLMYEKGEEGVFPAKIRIGKFEIQAWYSSPYPQEAACLPLLYICERCLMYMSNEIHHHEKCKANFPPGNEIYRLDNLSIFEVDGNLARVYCRNLCLLAKLFIDHKTLYFDVEPFLFYVMTVTDEHGCHFVGYFSKEKYSHQQFNLACIVTLPCYQKKGYGRFLIDFSYLLSRREKMLGTPERPLSEMGKIAYQSYWRTAIFEHLHNRREKGNLETFSAMEIAKATGISVHDVVDVLKEVGFLAPSNGEVIGKNQNLIWTIDWDMINKHWNTAKKSDRRIWMDESKLQWTPKVYTPNTDFFLRSPLRSPVFSPTHNSSPRKIQNFSSTIQQPRRPSHSSRKTSTSRFRIPVEQKSRKKSKNVQAAVFKKDVKEDSGVQSDDQESGSSRQPSEKPSTVVNSARSLKKEFSEDLSDSDINRRLQNAHSTSSIAASKNQPRQNNHTYLSCASNSSSEEDDDEDRTFKFSRYNSPANIKQSGVVGRKKLPAEVERAQQRSQQTTSTVDEAEAKPRQIRKSPSLSSVQSSDDDSDFDKRQPTRRPSAGKKKVPVKKIASKPLKTEENNTSTSGSRSRPASKKSIATKRIAAKKKSPSKQKSRKSESRSPTPTAAHLNEDKIEHTHDENTDEDDEPYRSSTSPPPLSKRPTRHSILHRTSVNQFVETMNLGGDPDFINMGGDPEDETQPSYAHSQTPKAPKPHASLEEDEENDALNSKNNLTNQNQQISNFPASSSSNNQISFDAPQIEQEQTWHKQSVDNYVNFGASSFNNVTPTFQQQSVEFPTAAPLPSNNVDLSQNGPQQHVKFMMSTSSPDPSTEMPILKPDADENLSEDEMPTLNEEENDAPPELSPMPALSEHGNDEPDSIEPPKLEDSTIPVSKTTTQSISNPNTAQSVSKAISFDSFVDQKTLALRKKSMPATMLCTSASTDERFENDSFGSSTTPLALPQLQQPQHPSPQPPNLHHSSYNNTSAHSVQNQMFSPQQAAVHTPNSLQPQSHASNSTASESGINVSEILSPPNLQKSVEHLLPSYVQQQQQTQQAYSPPKPSPLINSKSAGSRKEKQSRQPNATSRRRNTTDGLTLKPLTPSDQQSIDPKFLQQPAIANNPALNGMLLSAPPFINPYLMQTPIPTANPQFNAAAIAQQSAYNNYDYTQQPVNYPAFYGGNFYPPYQTAAGNMAQQFSAICQFQQQQQQQLPPTMIPTPQLPNFSQITNTALATNPSAAASLMNNGSLYYNGFG